MSSNPLQQYLISRGFLTSEQWDQAEQRARSEKITLMTSIEKLNFMDEEQLLEVFSKYYKVPSAVLSEKDIPHNIIDLIPKEIATKHRVIPIDRAGNNIIVAMANPRNLDAIDAIRFSQGFFAKPVLATNQGIDEAIERYYGRRLDIDKMTTNENIKIEKKKDDAERKDIAAQSGEGPIINLVNQILMQCMYRNASDIHIEPYETFLRVRLRIDGGLHEIARPPSSMKAALISRIKIMADLNIAETRLPQDGSINILIGDKPVDFRVNTLPTVYGEKIVMRILDKSNLQVDMTQLGFEEDDLKKFKNSIHNPFGMVLVTGPTGSGKTTTLYSALAELNKESENIMTAEDPVEYNLEGINQVAMKPSIGLDFSAALRAFLRQDPDIIMVGEIRDLETASIAIKAALTGHMVLSTLHTNSATDTISRLLNMGLEPFNLVAALTCVTAQRLLRKVCQHCRVVDEAVTAEHMIQLGVHPSYVDRVRAYKGEGCSKCAGTGTKGRVACHEVLRLNDPIREAILKGLPSMELKKVAMANGMRTLRQSALNHMIQGLTNVYEVTKSTSPDSDSDPNVSAA